MEKFKLSENIHPNKVFIVNRSELIGKLSPNIYANNFHFKSKIYPLFKLTDLAFINPTTTFSNIQQQEDITFIPMEAINQNLGIIDVEYTKKIEETKGYTKFKENDLIWAKITPCMQNGKSAIVRNTINGYACGSTEFFIIRCKTNTILIEYIHFILRDKRILKTAMNFFGGSAGQQRVSKDFLLNLLIPLPPLEIQRQIVDLYEKAYTEKQQKEAEAQKLLDSIDDYLLGELGITLPKEEEHLPQNNDKNNSYNLDNDNPLVKKGRLFLTNLSEVTGKRIDPYFYKESFKKAFSLIEKSQYPICKLKDISEKITSGITPLSGGDSYTNIREGIPFIRSGNIDINGNLNFEELLYLKPKIHNTIMKSSQLKKNDLIVAIVGATIGRVGIYLDNIEANINQAIALIRLKQEINPEYMKELINSSIGQLNLNRLKRPVARANINLEELATVVIVVPPLEKQNEIATYISQIRSKANILMEQGEECLEKGKQEVVQMILGN